MFFWFSWLYKKYQISYQYQNSQPRYCAICDHTVYIPSDNECAFVNIQLVFEIATLLKETPTKIFPDKFVKFLRTPILKNVCKQLLQLYSLKVTFDRRDVYQRQLLTHTISWEKLILFLEYFNESTYAKLR